MKSQQSIQKNKLNQSHLAIAEHSSPKPNRRDVLKYGLCGSLAASLAPWLLLNGCSKKKSHKPNVVLIVLDTMRGDRLSCLGYPRKVTPNIDRIATKSTIYSRAYSTDFWTLPSHASIFTGMYPSQIAATSETNQLPPSAVTLAEILSRADYHTAAFSCNSWVSLERGFGQGFAEFSEIWRPNKTNHAREHQPLETTATNEILSWLQNSQGKQQPFFAFVNLNATHMPYNPPEKYQAEFLGNGYDSERVALCSKISGMWAHLAGALPLDQADFRILRDLYDGEVAYVDSCVGQIVNCLKNNNMLDNTLLIITSDHGENLGEHGMIDHLLSMYDTTLHVPLIIHCPGKFPAGVVDSDLVSLVDIAPTILDVCGLTKSVDHLEIAQQSLAGPKQQKRQFVLGENERPVNGVGLMKSRYPAFDTSSIDCAMRAIRTKKHKLIWSIDRRIELFDLDTDPQELRDISTKDTAICQKLHHLLKESMRRDNSVNDTTLFESTDSESLEILRSLGYIE